MSYVCVKRIPRSELATTFLAVNSTRRHWLSTWHSAIHSNVCLLLSAPQFSLTCGANCLLFFFPFLFHYQNNNSVVNTNCPDGQQHPYGWMCKHWCNQWPLISDCCFGRTYLQQHPTTTRQCLIALSLYPSNLSHDYYIPILSCTFHTTFIQTCMGAEETYGALTLCRGASVSTPEIGGTSVVVSTWEFFFKSWVNHEWFFKKKIQ